MPPPPGCPDWAYPGMLLYGRRLPPGERYMISAIEMGAEGDFRVNVQRLRSVRGESTIDDSGNAWAVGGAWINIGELTARFEPLGYFNQISPYPRFRRQPEIQQTSLVDVVRMFGNALGGLGQVIQPLSDVPKAPPPRTVFEWILDEEDD